MVVKDWQIPLGRRFRALKVWFVLRTYGQEGLQKYLEHHLRLAKLFQGFVEADDRFEIMAPPRFGLICFALKVQKPSQLHLKPQVIAAQATCDVYVTKKNSSASSRLLPDSSKACAIAFNVVTMMLFMQQSSHR